VLKIRHYAKPQNVGCHLKHEIMKTKYLIIGITAILLSTCTDKKNDNNSNNQQKIENVMDTVEKNKQVVRQFYEEGWNGRNFEIVRQTHSENWVHHDNSNPNDLGGGPEGNIKRMKELVHAFPDLRFDIEDMVAENDKVVVRFIASGTQKGQFGPIPPTDKQVKMLGYITHRLEYGKIVEDWVVRDTYGLMIQLGVIQHGKK
jgi:steroid delta-isomerase-like uncharacterized protein